MFVVEEYQPAVVQVEGHHMWSCGKRTGPQPARRSVFVYALQHYDGAVTCNRARCIKDLFQVVLRHDTYQFGCIIIACRQFDGRLRVCRCHFEVFCTSASRLHVFTGYAAIGIYVNHHLRLHVVGKSETEFAKFAVDDADVRIFTAQGVVGVIAPMLVYDVADDAVCPWRLHSEAATMPYAPEPYPRSPYSLHTLFNHLVSRVFPVFMVLRCR